MRKRSCLIRIFLILILIFSTLISTGCWDMVELEDRVFALGIALDKGEKEGEVILTYQLALPTAMYGEKGGDGEKVMNISTSTSSVIEGNKQLAARLNRVLNIEHLQVFIIGEELAKEGINEYLDYFFRDINMRRKTDILVAKGKAKDIFEITPLTALSTSHYLADLMRLNETRMYRISTEVDMLEISKNVREKSDYMVAKVEKQKEDIVVSGAAVFRRDKLVGYLDAQDTRKAKWMTNNMDTGTIQLENVGESKGKVVFNVSESKTTVKPVIQENKVDFDVYIRVEGNVSEMSDVNFKNTLTSKFINALEEKVEAAVRQDCVSIMNEAQQKLEADFLDLGHLVKRYNIRWWEQHEDRWREIFKESKLNLKIDVYVRRVGLSK
ncbi:Ger(x)C family spore germination protein [Petroclostridium sp. X23]|uniref:Ger(x)C family spore germination protein n=1 Tax=Petroclostridium sp. X23 TaxID=3045146 RepID=UPI0024AC8C8F|nr:Ger(x)C family spore germination protein [Petroclostridium sp. X23]WHH57097.1 Ger(x)C family spore germination protein [Petroclostridium sp. X23]